METPAEVDGEKNGWVTVWKRAAGKARRKVP
jgi:hypothetical protein